MEIFIVIFLILLNGLFSMSEIAVISARKASLMSEAKSGSKSAKAALNLANDPDRFLSTIQIGITLIGILTGLYSGDVLAGDFDPILQQIGVPASISYSLSQIIIVALVTFLTLIFGELVPKRIGLSVAEKVAKIMARPMYLLSLLSSPIVWLLSKCTSLMFNLLNLKNAETKVTEAEIKSMMQEGLADGEVQEVEQDIMERVFSLGDRDLESIMTHRSELVWLDIKMTRSEILEVIKSDFHDVYPVATRGLDNVDGVVLIEDLFGAINEENFDLQKLLRPAQFFHETMEVYKALELMRDKRSQYALVCDEFGSIQGIVTMIDILEGLVGALPSPLDEPEIIQRQDGGWLVDGQCPFYDFLDYFGLEEIYSQFDFNTVSGLILNQLERIPTTGEITEWNSFQFEIVDMDGARIDKLLVTLKPALDEELAD